MSDDRSDGGQDNPVRLPPLIALRERHARLLAGSATEPPAAPFLAEVQDFVAQGCETGTLLEAPEDRAAAQGLLNYWGVFLDRSGRGLPDVVLKSFDAQLLPEVKECPYLGLQAFHEENSRFFFGRKQKVAGMVEHLQQQRLLAVVGPSGSGKSSVVLAGLLPRLRKDAIAGSGEWRHYGPMVPGSSPLANLARVVRDVCSLSAEKRQSLMEEFLDSPDALCRMLDEAKKVGVLIVDQFEEVFSLCQNERHRMAFIENLRGAIERGRHPHRVILTMRGDFEEYLPRLGPFYELFEQHKFTLTAMTLRELREAVEEPANLVGLHFEGRLVDELLQDLLGEPAGLPLLQFTLLKLWEKRKGSRVAVEEYRNLGGGRQALQRVADEVYNGLLLEDRERARYIFLRMVQPGAGLEVTSRRIQRVELCPTQGHRQSLDPVVEKLVAAHLVRLTKGDRADEDQLEVAHESLLRNWGQLVEWLSTERDRIRERMLVTQKAEQWDRLGQDPGALLRGVLLDRARSYKDLNTLETAFVAASDAAMSREQRHLRKLVRQRELERDRAQQQARVATARELAAESQIPTRYPGRGLLLALAALQATRRQGEPPVPAAEEALRTALAASRGRGLGKHHKDHVSAVLITPDCRRLISASHDWTVRVWDLTAATPWRASFALRAHEGSVDMLAMSPDSRWLVTGSSDKTVRAWDMCAAEPASSGRVLKRFERSLRTLAISPEGRWLVVGTEERVILCWDLHDLSLSPRELHGHAWGTRGIVFSADGAFMASASDDGTVRLWDFRGDWPDSTMLAQFESAARTVSISPEGRWLAAGGLDGTVRLWARERPAEPPRVLRDCQGGVMAMALTSRWLVAGASDCTLRLWNLAELSAPPLLLPCQEEWIRVVDVSPDGHWLITCTGNGTFRLWDLENADPGSQRGPCTVLQMCGTHSATISSDSRCLAIGADDGTVQLVDLASPASPPSPRILDRTRAPVALSSDSRWLATLREGHDNTVLLADLATPSATSSRVIYEGRHVRAIATSPNGRWLAVGSEEPGIRVWDLTDPDLSCRELPGHKWGIQAIAFSADSRRLISGGDDWSVRIWDPTSQDAELWYLQADQGVVAVTVSPDQRWVIAGECEGTVRVWDFAHLNQAPRVLRRERRHIHILRVSPDSRWLVTGARDEKHVCVWDLNGSAGSPAGVLDQDARVTDVVFSPDSRRLVGVSESPQVRIWDMANLNGSPRVLRGHEWGIRSVAINPEGRWLATGSDDRTVRLWSFDDLAVDPVVLHVGEPVTQLAFSQDSHWLVAAGTREATRLWTLRLRELSELACRTAGRNFTLEEWKQYFPRRRYRRVCRGLPVPFEVVRDELRRAHAEAPRSRAAAAKAYRRAVRWASETDDADLNNRVGRRACIDCFAITAMAACERAVALSPANGDYRDTRGIARALTDDYSGAIEDFQFYLSQANEKLANRVLARRRNWIEVLCNGRNPIDVSTLNALEEEEPAIDDDCGLGR